MLYGLLPAVWGCDCSHSHVIVSTTPCCVLSLFAKTIESSLCMICRLSFASPHVFCQSSISLRAALCSFLAVLQMFVLIVRFPFGSLVYLPIVSYAYICFNPMHICLYSFAANEGILGFQIPSYFRDMDCILLAKLLDSLHRLPLEKLMHCLLGEPSLHGSTFSSNFEPPL